MPVITTTPIDATWTNGVAMDEAELRRSDSAMFLGDGSNNGVRGGVVRHGDTSLAVSVNGSDQVTVQTGAAVIPAATGLGVYRASLSAATAATGLSPRNATNPRIDLVVMQIVSGQAVVQTVDGTPGASPSAPALPANAVELARLTVPAVAGGAVTVSNAFRQFTTGLGGLLYVESVSRLPGSGNQKSQRAVDLATGLTHRWSGSEWLVDDSAAGSVTGAITGSGTCFTRQGSGYIVLDVTAPAGAALDGVLFNTPNARYNPPVTIHDNLTDPATNASWLVRVTSAGQVQTVTAMPPGKRIIGTLKFPVTGV